MSKNDDPLTGCGCLAIVVFIAGIVWAIWFSETIIETALAVFVALSMMPLIADKK